MLKLKSITYNIALALSYAISPVRISNDTYGRKRLLHKGYEIYNKVILNQYEHPDDIDYINVHICYIDTLDEFMLYIVKHVD